MTPTAAPAAPTVGRQQSCGQCGATYRARRSTARYCSPACRQQVQRGAPPINRPAPSVILKLLLRLQLAGRIGPVNARDPRPAVHGLTVPRSHAYEELHRLYDRKGWGVLSEAEFAAELKAHAIVAYDEDYRARH